MLALDTYQLKVLDLFQFRKIDWLFTQSGFAKDSGYFRQLMEIQARIYDLDHYLETNWIVMPARLNTYWDRIEEGLQSFGISELEIPDLLSDIKQYQSQELFTRSGGDPVQVPIADFYHFKTCDVRLMRRLLYRGDPRLNRIMPEAVWGYYDWITEVHDDLSDVVEDRHTHNVNRYLASLESLGPRRTLEQYVSYLRQVLAVSEAALAQRDFAFITHFQRWLEEAYQATRTLLNQHHPEAGQKLD